MVRSAARGRTRTDGGGATAARRQRGGYGAPGSRARYARVGATVERRDPGRRCIRQSALCGRTRRRRCVAAAADSFVGKRAVGGESSGTPFSLRTTPARALAEALIVN